MRNRKGQTFAIKGCFICSYELSYQSPKGNTTIDKSVLKVVPRCNRRGATLPNLHFKKY